MDKPVFNAPIAQMDRAPVYGTGCCWFDSNWAHFNRDKKI